MRFFISIFFILFLLPTYAVSISSPPVNRVIYITLDGTRWQDVYNEEGFLKQLWDKYKTVGTFYGKPHTNMPIEVASVPISLPSYQSQMTGSIQPCMDNHCGRVAVQTLPEYLVQNLGLAKRDVAVFSSWIEVDYAVQRESGKVFTNVGNLPMHDPDTGEVDSIMAQLNQLQKKDGPRRIGDRFDIYTFEQALHYFDKYQPRFMWIALTDSDNAAHENDRDKYYRALYYYNVSLGRLFALLKEKNLDKDTLVIVTTDHGRGNGAKWTTHGTRYPESKQTWAFVMNGQLMQVNQKYSTLSIRPTVESALSKH